MLKILPKKTKWFFVLVLLFSKNITNAQYLAYASSSDFLDLSPTESFESFETTTTTPVAAVIKTATPATIVSTTTIPVTIIATPVSTVATITKPAITTVMPVTPTVVPATPVAITTTPVTTIAMPVTPTVVPATSVAITTTPITTITTPVTSTVVPVTPVAITTTPVTTITTPVTPTVVPATPVAITTTPITTIAMPVTPTVVPATPVAITTIPVTTITTPVTSTVVTATPAMQVTSTSTEIKTAVIMSVGFGKQIWMKTNLDVSRYRNGDEIPQVQDPEKWSNLTTGAWCYYENNTSNGVVYGKLYNWYAVHDPRGLAPVGWHIPSDEEWTALTDFLGGANVAGEKMKLILSNTSNKEELNKNNFSGLLGGLINDAPCKFAGIGRSGIWWSSTAVYGSYAWYRGLYFNNKEVTRNYLNKTIGFSVRCVKD